MADPALLAVCGAGGLLSGVLVDAIALRHRADVESDLPLSPPWSRCTDCSVPMHGLEYVPVAGSLRRHGRCRECGHVLGVSQLAVEVINGVLWVLAAIRFGATAPLIPFLLLFSGLLVLALVDLRTYRLPDRLTFPMLYSSAALITVLSLVQHHPIRILYAAAGSLGFFAFLALMAFISPKGMGWGDVKLARLLGLWLGWLSPFLVIHALLVAGMAGVVVGLLVLVARRGRSAPFPFGPWLAFGAIVVILVSPSLIAAT